MEIIDSINKNITFSVISVVSVMRGFYLFNQEITAITDQKASFSVVSVMSVVSVVGGLYLSSRYLQIIDTSNENKDRQLSRLK